MKNFARIERVIITIIIFFSSSDLSSLAASPGALALLTPTSRRKQLLLLQHQQRSSLDTDALDEEFDASQVNISTLFLYYAILYRYLKTLLMFLFCYRVSHPHHQEIN